MVKFRGTKEAFGKPGIEPKWTNGNKDGVGTSYLGESRLWFTIWNGIVTEVYYPFVDAPQIRDLQYLITDNETFFQDEKKNLKSEIKRLNRDSLGYKITNSDPEGRYKIVKEIVCSPNSSCLLQNTWLEGDEKFLSKLQIYALCAPHMAIGGKNNNAYVVDVGGLEVLVAEKSGTWMAMGASIPFSKTSCGFVGFSDGWTDVHDNFKMDWSFDQAKDGNVALIGELKHSQNFTLALAFGDSLQCALSCLNQNLGIPFSRQKKNFLMEWQRLDHLKIPLEQVSQDQGNLYHSSHAIMVAHEDKTFKGAFIASLSIPWGETKGDKIIGGYHLVWTRDLVQCAQGLLAGGNTDAPLRALIYLSTCQNEDGKFPQNFWVDGSPYSNGLQLDEVAFPLILAFRLNQDKALENFNPCEMMKRGASFLMKSGPLTEQDRWEEDIKGYSPSTIATMIAGLICTACHAKMNGFIEEAQYIEEYADYLESHLEEWTVTTTGTLDSDVKKHYLRINPINPEHPNVFISPNESMVTLPDRLPNAQKTYPAKEIIDAGFLELVRFGIRKPDDPLIVNSLKVIDKCLKVETPFGPCWRRYTHDGYGQNDDGSPFVNWGRGRAWPLLAAERAHYELAAGRSIVDLVKAVEGFGCKTGILPEQVWDAADLPEAHMFLGQSTGSARPLVWAHAEYTKLLRSINDKKVFDKIDEVEDRYVLNKHPRKLIEIWQLNHQVQSIKGRAILRIQSESPFELKVNLDQSKETLKSKAILDLHYVDIDLKNSNRVQFSFNNEEKIYKVEKA